MKYKIKKANKYSCPPLPLLSLGKKTFTWKVTFDESCIYQLGNQTDIQKLCGIGWLPGHHINSARFGWRWIPEKNQVELLAYCYDKGVRLSSAAAEHSIRFVDLNKEYLLRLVISDIDYYFTVTDGKIMGDRVVPKTYKTPWLGFYLRPYFEADGAIGTPHDMTFTIQ